MYALPDGLPGYEGMTSKVHLIGHSMGALTARHFQHMLNTGVFTHNYSKRLIAPSADFVKSITSLAGAINGSLAPLNHGGNWCPKNRKTKFNPYGLFISSYKMTIWAQNIFKS
mgnify:CR=1 FL=1